ncbi:hypothetical protein AQUSIP_03550 [Aquicella siphonis]|uniref:Secretory immunoglobulin A-binding protein EsiB n=1 Tax=Aquicella siphonis TaxID=254247 RepID=A0A5E4PDQ3_9COXI|nr:sel1 repeat family protein [Aquicella siphonis]VVC75079.1 hypothetical protein AQUSIP_03550 [Aquicella siphonis]
MTRIIIICLTCFSLLACATTSPRVQSELNQGKRYFEQGYYKRAMHELLPIACDGNAEAQYAVGYMYYYGLGVAQDTDVGHFWIMRSASKGYPPAIKALEMIEVSKKSNRPSPWKKTG